MEDGEDEERLEGFQGQRSGTPIIKLLGVLSGVTLAACGSTSTQTATSTIATTASALRFSQCVRANGAPSFPDPGPGGYQRRGINLDSPAVQSAMNACEKYLPPSGDSPV